MGIFEWVAKKQIKASVDRMDEQAFINAMMRGRRDQLDELIRELRHKWQAGGRLTPSEQALVKATSDMTDVLRRRKRWAPPSAEDYAAFDNVIAKLDALVEERGGSNPTATPGASDTQWEELLLELQAKIERGAPLTDKENALVIANGRIGQLIAKRDSTGDLAESEMAVIQDALEKMQAVIDER